MGSVILSAEYNTANNDYTSKTQMENSEFAVSAPPYRNVVYGMECARNWTNSLFVRNGQSVLNGPLTDLGTFFIATNAVQTGTVGELWVSYDIEFTRPRASNTRFGIYHMTGSGSNTSVPLVNPSTVVKVLNGAFSSVYTNGNTVYFPDALIGDIYCIQASFTTASTSITAVPNFSQTGFSAPLSLSGGTVNGILANSATVFNATYYYQVVTSNPTLTISNGTAATAAVYTSDVVILDVGNGFTASQI
jgi:hypothetical protein